MAKKECFTLISYSSLTHEPKTGATHYHVIVQLGLPDKVCTIIDLVV